MADRELLLREIWQLQHEIYDLMTAYSETPYHYAGINIHEAEGEILNKIADHPGITVTELGTLLHKTTSACSQTVGKLRTKGVVEQKRNPENPQRYNLVLTELGQQIHEDRFNRDIQAWEQAAAELEDVSNDDLKALLRIQRRINRSYLGLTGV